ncbi:hypothetical protein SPF06_21575 [Sinomonas sp. JGH33]|uniref:CopG family transcriptional regulator n=1 Tax=Sinomonas terricola TaxID=3110330 RepID=A0ABU5TCY7_9MICC|nr:hypothetical protein [Sinomonas sp. JGH33]MEA5457316.1 hypothetical protein [Sinomonas sp. JGH33]
MSSTDRSFGNRQAQTIRLPEDHFDYYDGLAAAENLSFSDWLTKELANGRGLPVPDYVGRQRRRKRARELSRSKDVSEYSEEDLKSA